MPGEPRKPVWIRWFPKDALDGMTELTPMEELVYRRLLDMIVCTDDQLHDDDRALTWSTKAGREWRKIKGRLLALGKIHIEDGFIRNRRASQSCSESRGFIAQKVNASRARGGRHKALETLETGSAGDIPSDPSGDPSGEPPIQHPTISTAPQGADASAQEGLQASGDVERTVGQRLFSEGLTTLARLLEEPMPENRNKVARLVRKMQTEAGDDALLLAVILDAGAKPPREPVAWIRRSLQAKAAPRLVVSNDPEDAWGVQGWCASLQGVSQSDPEDRDRGQWVIGDTIVDAAATRVCEAARLSVNWRGNLDAIAGWIADGIKSDTAARAIDRVASREGYVAAEVRSIGYFDRAVREARPVAA